MNLNLEAGQTRTTPQTPTGTLTTIPVEVVLLVEETFHEDEMITMIVVTTSHVHSLASHLVVVVVHQEDTMTVVAGEREDLSPHVTVVVGTHHRVMEEEIKVGLLLIVVTLATPGTEDSSLVY